MYNGARVRCNATEALAAERGLVYRSAMLVRACRDFDAIQCSVLPNAPGCAAANAANAVATVRVPQRETYICDAPALTLLWGSGPTWKKEKKGTGCPGDRPQPSHRLLRSR